ncbi:phosphotransferase enzyme family protein [Kocuria sp. CPCC 205263]|uniref:phosphotransferase enzyme family protein n=1 Tax=Kocuria sp. CPCC 205263 TaxID=3073555 RepID=UPI0034D698E8
MNATTFTSPLAVFDDLRRGDPAPDWIVAAAVTAWDLDPARTLISMMAVSENATFRVDVDGTPCWILRVHRPGHVGDNAQIASELTWMHRLAEDTQVHVPGVVPTASGQLVHAFTGSNGAPWFCVAFTFVAGVILEDVADPRPYYGRIGAITARLHDQVQHWAPPTGFTRFSWRLEDMLGKRSRWGDWRRAELTTGETTVLERAELAAVTVLDTLPHTPEYWGLVHADLRPSNIMIDDDVLTVIDFDDCGFSWLLYDFASALSFIEHEAYTPDIAKSWVEGYRTVRPLDDESLAHAAALSMVRRLTLLGWTTTHRPDALPSQLWDAQIPGTVSVAERYLVSPTWLFD